MAHWQNGAVSPTTLDESKEERKTRLARATEFVLATKTAYESQQLDTSTGNDRVLWMTATRWVRSSGVCSGDKTLLCAHANGLHGTTYAPLLRRLLAQRQDIAEVWALDSVQHGDAALLNDGRFGVLYDWHEMARDALCFLQHFLPPTLGSAPLPVHLPQISHSKSAPQRKVDALGHSFGGSALILAAAHNPSLFSSLMLADPVILPPTAMRTLDQMSAHVAGALSRRSRWPSRQAAYNSLAANPFFGIWDKEVLDVYVKYALAEDGSGEVRLKCDGISEGAVFAEMRSSKDAWAALPTLDRRVPVLWISPPAGKKQFVLQSQELADARIRLRPASSAHVTIPDGTHLLVQTHPRRVADAAHTFLQAIEAGDVGDLRELQLHDPDETAPAQSPSRARL
ncbi:unnamed protein product [Peniophora sp. CBMAI 1063]|nr:unnamed protein product [Peniophora sp. CBMAI 1063]